MILVITDARTMQVSETKMKLEAARSSGKEMQKKIEAQAKKIKELHGYYLSLWLPTPPSSSNLFLSLLRLLTESGEKNAWKQISTH